MFTFDDVIMKEEHLHIIDSQDSTDTLWIASYFTENAPYINNTHHNTQVSHLNIGSSIWMIRGLGRMVIRK